VLRILLSCLKDETNSNETGVTKERIESFLKMLQEYWHIHDMDYGSIHSNIFETMYIKNEGLSQNTIALHFYISEASIKRYAKRYDRVAKSILHNYFSDIEEILLQNNYLQN
jgi:hypothetical protein